MKAYRAAAVLIAALGLIGPAGAQELRGGRESSSQGQARQKEEADAKRQAPQRRQEKQFPVSVPWLARSLNNRSFSGDRPAITLDANFRIKGFGGCNTFSATAYPLRNQGFAVGPLALTKRSCDKATSDLERSFLVALRTAQKWDVTADGTTLVIQGQNGELRFERSL